MKHNDVLAISDLDLAPLEQIAARALERAEC